MKINSKNVLIVLAVVVFLGFAYFAVSSKKSTIGNSNNSEIKNNEISLEITAPKDGEILTKSPVSVTGTTVKSAEVFVNDAETKADESGNFKVSVSLDEGENEIFVTVNDQDGNNTESSVKVNLNTE
ncbi:MAG: hypothetical protein NTV24_02575 [Candidatus Woesebacteria bacterium]|nr:hypothetical protein [Candidatus Woesebacteria bacterium]